MFVVRDVNRGVRPLVSQRPCWSAPGGAGWRCRRVLVAEDVRPLNVGGVPRAIVPNILGNQGAQCVEREVVGLCFVWRQSCAEWMQPSAKWADMKVLDARAAEPVQLLGPAAAEVMPKERSAVLVEYLRADSAPLSRSGTWSFTFGHLLALCFGVSSVLLVHCSPLHKLRSLCQVSEPVSVSHVEGLRHTG